MSEKVVTKEDLAEELIAGGKVKLLKGEALKAITVLFSEMTKALMDEEGGTVKIAGFGTFTLVERPARKGVNPSNTKEVIEIPASKTIKFKPSKTLKDVVNSK